ncbi:hypothetical protein FNU79_11000 [Deinococcus detaillensis]|uniref:Uncharacterized protein n=1 Tax=Deinococcus detaillensis TaxID=2592048 RepID=A0A553UWA8_9DEIO|nr:hypothetical protein [Deinococcus detaillensis]TSA84485.1 hypothetical protein FNU79_11000 [Deinococcus detaillensis]
MPSPTYLRSICSVPLTPDADARDPALWARVFTGWQFQEPDNLEALDRVIELIRLSHQAEVRRGLLVYATWPQASGTLPALVNLSADGRFVTLRVFASHLTEVQRRSEQLTEKLLREKAFSLPEEVRVKVAINLDGLATDLTAGRVNVRRGGALRGFYEVNKYALNVTSLVLVVTLLIFLLVTPDSNFTPLGKFYGLSGRILSAVLLNALLLASQFLFFARHRQVIDWETP